MNHAMLWDHLSLAERHIGDGDVLIARQRDIVERFLALGIDTKQAEFVLALLAASQKEYLADREHLLLALASSK